MLLANTPQIREADRIQIEELGLPGIILMETAARKATERLLELYPQQRSFWVLAGPGNNGGYGLAMARRLHLADKTVRVLLSHDPARYTGDALVNYQLLHQLPVPIETWHPACVTDWSTVFVEAPILIDALLGTGIQAELRGSVLALIKAFLAQDLTPVAVDLPSGLNADSGYVANPVLPARHTFTFQLPKICHYLTPAANLCGEVHTLDIEIWPSVIKRLGIQRQVLSESFVREQRKDRAPDSHKGSFGHLLLLGGSGAMSGAIAMSAKAAVRSGVGLATVVCPGASRQTVLNHVPEAMCQPMGPPDRMVLMEDDWDEIAPLLAGKQALVIGPGMGQHPATVALLHQILNQVTIPMVWDADALNLLATHPDWWERLPSHTILTPHPGELRRLMQDPSADQYRLESAETLARNKQVVVVLKGQNTVIALPNGQTYVNPTGNAGMATGGTGDVLTGIIGALLAQSFVPGIAAALAVWAHGTAGDQTRQRLGEAGLTAMELIHDLRLD